METGRAFFIYLLTFCHYLDQGRRIPGIPGAYYRDTEISCNGCQHSPYGVGMYLPGGIQILTFNNKYGPVIGPDQIRELPEDVPVLINNGIQKVNICLALDSHPVTHDIIPHFQCGQYDIIPGTLKSPGHTRAYLAPVYIYL